MPPRKSYNPYKINTESINRFRGVANPENELTMAKVYVGSSNNCVSFRTGELTIRSGQVRESI
jgi:hypothetical protein